jgi:hypothetical protein
MQKNNPKKSIIAIIEWSAFVKALIVLILIIIVGIFFIWGSQQSQYSMIDWERQQRNKFGKIETEYRQLKNALEIVNNSYLEKLDQLKKKGFLKDSFSDIEKQRIEVLNKIVMFLSQLQQQLFDVNYNLSEKKLYSEPSFLSSDSQFKTYQSNINLTFGFLHEGDLLKLIKTIEFQLKSGGILNLQTCNIKRTRNIISTKDVSKPYFEASCVIVWYTSKIEEEMVGLKPTP